MKSKIIDILEKHFDDPAKIDDWTTIYMQEKFIAIAMDIEDFIKENYIKIRKTSQEWYDNYPIQIIDPDGWDRNNFQYSWYEERITFEEFDRRAMASTCMIHKPGNNDTIRSNK